ncbi:MAG: hypothetical protein U5R06_19835 [candidate division KSB1 bacterium]|nr:hypothetical protein [candidate division KSB1 bacterium]
MSLFELQKPREFKIETYYYHPPEEEKRIQFRRLRRSERIEKKSPLRLIAVLILIIWAIIYLQKKGGSVAEQNGASTNFQVESVEVVD